jgi:hypothetical protein
MVAMFGSARGGMNLRHAGPIIVALERIITANAEFNRESHRQLIEQLHSKPRTKVYLSQPETFKGTIGQEVELWLNKFNMWFKHREDAGETIDDGYKIESAIMRTAGDTNSALTAAHQSNTFTTWAAFEKHMLVKYSSNDTAYTRYTALRAVTQRPNESVTTYCQQFQVALGRLNAVPVPARPRHTQRVLLCGHTVPGRARAVPRAWLSREQARPGPPKASPGQSLC